jgi:hypothetical protein
MFHPPPGVYGLLVGFVVFVAFWLLSMVRCTLGKHTH